MPRESIRNTPRRPSGGERVFTDALGRMWTATFAIGEAGETSAVVFICISEVRQSGRAIAVELSASLGEVAEETLRAWLSVAPRIGTLT
ncbi:MAG: hypothetical protein ACREN3_00600 [Gemmatimonadaceae bacterium]